jgi:hypothetical protein
MVSDVYICGGRTRQSLQPRRLMSFHERLRGRGQSNTTPGPPLFVARITKHRSDIKRPSAEIRGGSLHLELAITTAYQLTDCAYRFGRPGGVALVKTSRFFSM